jgi:hypothetical protein
MPEDEDEAVADGWSTDYSMGLGGALKDHSGAGKSRGVYVNLLQNPERFTG